MISNSMKETVWVLKESEHLSNSEIARRVGISRTKVIEILKQPIHKNAQLVDSYKKIKQEETESLYRMLSNDNRLPQIASQILDIMNDPEQLEKEIQRNGLRPLATVLGIISDKTLKARELEIKEVKTDTSTEDEPVTIVNDAPLSDIYGTNIN